MNGFILKNLPDRECLEMMAERHPEMNPDATEVYLHLLRVGADLGDRVEQYFDKHSISTGRMSILMMLNACPDEPRTPGEIAERCGVTAATISRLVDGLIANGYVERVPDPQNRRVSPIQMTSSGKDFLAKVLPDYFSGISQAFSTFNAQDRVTFLTLLNKLQIQLNESKALL